MSLSVHAPVGSCTAFTDHRARARTLLASQHVVRRGAPNEINLVVGYARVSTDEQALGPEAQRGAIESWCAAHGARLLSFYIDAGVSGGAPLDRRPALLAAIEDVRRQAAHALVVAKRDRLARDTFVATMVERILEREGARVLGADGSSNGDGPEAQLMRGVIDVFAAYERSMIKSRTKAALGVKRAKGERVGGIPYGIKLAADGVHLESDPAERAIIAEVLDLRARRLSIRAIAHELNHLRRPARGCRWHATSVARILALA